tara:strand:- start:510 stop:812 length:303 start_codon:yes stop_codon:yes gene_type:complete
MDEWMIDWKNGDRVRSDENERNPGGKLLGLLFLMIYGTRMNERTKYAFALVLAVSDWRTWVKAVVVADGHDKRADRQTYHRLGRREAGVCATSYSSFCGF